MFVDNAISYYFYYFEKKVNKPTLNCRICDKCVVNVAKKKWSNASERSDTIFINHLRIVECIDQPDCHAAHVVYIFNTT